MSKDNQQAYSTHFDHLADLKGHVGKEIGISPWETITQEKINTFAKVTGDEQWIHVDEEKSAAHSPYKKPVAHGFMVLSYASKFCYETFSIGDVTMGLNYGLNKVRFPNATLVGAEVRGRISLLSYEEKKGGGRYVLKVDFELKGQEKPACVAEFVAMAYAEKTEEKPLPQATIENNTTTSCEKELPVLFEKRGRVALITINRPKRYNAVNLAVTDTINDYLRKIRHDDEIRAVVLTGAGKGFCAGADMDSFGIASPEEAREYITNVYQALMRSFFTLKKPIIGAINGTAAGVGASIALACDLRVMSAKSSLLYAFINIGLGPDGGASWLLARQVGYSRAMQIAIDGEKVRGEKCLEWGLANKLVDCDEIVKTAIDWANKLADKPTLAIGITKEDMMYAMENDLYDTVAFEAEKQMAAFPSHDFKEGVSAFVQKRKPNFLGR